MTNNRVTKLVIAVSGDPGSGKTTVCAPLAWHLGIRRVYFGQIVRDMAIERGVTLMEFQAHLAAHPELDTALEARQIEEAKAGDVLLEGRMSAWAIREAHVPGLALYLSVQPEVQATRLAGRDGGSLTKNASDAMARHEEMRLRFLGLYGVDFTDPSFYDATIDTSTLTPDEVYAAVLAHVRAYQEHVGLPVADEF